MSPERTIRQRLLCNRNRFLSSKKPQQQPQQQRLLLQLLLLALWHTMCRSSSSPTAKTNPNRNDPLLAADSAGRNNGEGSNNPNRKWVLKRRPVGVFDPELDAELVYENNDGDDGSATEQALKETDVLVEPQLLSVDAFVRTMLDEHAYHGSLPIGATLPALGYGRVVEAGSKSGHSPGTIVAGMLAASDRVVVDGKAVVRSFKIPFLERSAWLGLLGITTGLTAYCGVFYVPSRSPSKGETVVVTGAAGAVGSVAVQLCKSRGARVVGVAGGERKGDYLRTVLGCDAVVDYKAKGTSSLEEKIAEACPDGIDFVYDNVGGEILDALLEKINRNARVVICGAISQYSGNLNSKTRTVEGPSNYLKLAERGAEMKGFNVMQHAAKLPLMLIGMLFLYARGKVSVAEHREEGLEQYPHALRKLFTGETIGKTLVRVRRDCGAGGA